MFGVSTIAGLDDVGIAIMGNTMCFLWICAFVPLAARQLIERPAARAKSSKSLCAETFGGLAQTFKEAKRYPQTFKYVCNHHVIPCIQPVYTFITIFTPMYTCYTCIHTIYTKNTSKHPLNTLNTP